MRLLERALNRTGYLSKAQAAEAVTQAVVATAQRYDTRTDRYGSADARGGFGATMGQLRGFADQCDVARWCINERKRLVQGTEFVIEPLEGQEDSDIAKAQVDAALDFLETSGGLGGPGIRFNEFLGMTLEDYLVCGCLALYRRQTRGGQTFSVEAIDAATIKPIFTEGGWVPQEGVAFEQYINGRKVGAGFEAQEMRYLRYDSRTHTRWRKSPTDYARAAILQYLGHDTLAQSWLNDGDMERSYWSTPEEWTTAQVDQLRVYLLTMNETWAKRVETPIVPGADLKQTRPHSEANTIEAQSHLIKRVAAAYDLNASVVGFAGEMYKVAQGEQIRVAQLKAALPTLLDYKVLLLDVLREDCGLDLITGHWNLNTENRQAMAQIAQVAGPGVLSPNEARDLVGMPEAEGPFVDCLTRANADGSITVLGWSKGATPPSEAAPALTPTVTPAVEPMPVSAPPMGPTAPLGKALSSQAVADLHRWRGKALRYAREGNLSRCAFGSEAIPAGVKADVEKRLEKAQTEAQVRAVFAETEPQPQAVDAAQRLAGDLETLLAGVREERAKRGA